MKLAGISFLPYRQNKRMTKNEWIWQQVGQWLGFPGGTSGGKKKTTCQCRRPKRFGFDPWVRKICWSMAWQPTPVFLPGDSHWQRSQWAIIHSVTKSRSWLKHLSAHMQANGQHIKPLVQCVMLCFGVANGQNRSEKTKPEIGQSQWGMTDTAYRLQGYGTSLVVQWLRLQAPKFRGPGFDIGSGN